MCSLTGPCGNYRAPGLTALKAKILLDLVSGRTLPGIDLPPH